MNVELNEEETQVLKSHFTRQGVLPMNTSDWDKVRPENKRLFVDLLVQFGGMNIKLREKYISEFTGSEQDNAGNGLMDKALKESAHAILGMGQEEWDGLSKRTQERVLEKFEVIKQAGRTLADERIEKGTSEEIRTILNAPNEEWSNLPKTVTDRVLRKFETLASKQR